MKLIVEVKNNNKIIESYSYNEDSFLFNEKTIEVKDKVEELVYLIGLTTHWHESDFVFLESGFHVLVEINDYRKEYFFANQFEDNFLTFFQEVRNIANGGI